MSMMCFSYKRLHKVLKKKILNGSHIYLVLKKKEEQNSRFFEHQF